MFPLETCLHGWGPGLAPRLSWSLIFILATEMLCPPESGLAHLPAHPRGAHISRTLPGFLLLTSGRIRFICLSPD